MSGFRSPQTVYKHAAGEYVGGRWVPGAAGAPETIQASIQPATVGDYDTMQATIGGRRIERMIRIYSDAELTPAGEDWTNGDEVLWRGSRYLVVAVSPWQSDVIPHFRMYAVKRLES